MRSIPTLLILLVLCLFSSDSISQNQAFWVHEDQVKPGMRRDYEKTSKELLENAIKHNLQDVMWNVASMDNGTFLAIIPIKELGDIQKMSLEPLKDKMGSANFTRLMEDFDKCYENHGDYVVILNSELSYMPDGLSPDTPGKEYRQWHRMEVDASDVEKLKEKLKELKSYFTEKDSKMHYRIYQNGFGNVGNYYLAVISAKDAQDYAKISADNEILLGEKGMTLFEDIFQYVSKYQVTSGKMRPDLSYSPPH